MGRRVGMGNRGKQNIRGPTAFIETVKSDDGQHFSERGKPSSPLNSTSERFRFIP